MNFSVFTLVTTILATVALISGLSLWLKHTGTGNYLPGAVLAILSLPLLRLLIAVEFPFTREIKSDTLYPVVYRLLQRNVALVGTYALTVESLLVILWLSVSALFFAREFLSYRRITVSLRHLVPLRNTAETSIVEEILHAKKYDGRTVRVARSASVAEPLIFGIVHPTIVLPAGEFSSRELRWILSHELAHFLHGDLILKWILETVCALYWWLPLISSLKKRIYYIMEVRADNLVIGGQDRKERLAYLETLLRICVQRRNHPQVIPVSISLFGYGGNAVIKQRFQAIYNRESQRKAKGRSIAMVLAVCLAVIGSYAFILQPHFETPSTDQDSFAVDKENFYFVPGSEGGYDLYKLDGTHMGLFTKLEDELLEVPIYNSVHTYFHEEAIS